MSRLVSDCGGMSQVVMFIMEGKITALGLPEVFPFQTSAVLCTQKQPQKQLLFFGLQTVLNKSLSYSSLIPSRCTGQ